MKRLNEKNINSPQQSAKLFKKRLKMGMEVNWKDKERFELMLYRFKGGRLIDLGCFNASLPLIAKRKFPEAEIYALDYSQEVINYLKEKFPEINWVKEDCLKTNFPNEYFDYVTAGELIEHLENPKALLLEAFRILKKGGWFVLSTPFEEGKGYLWLKFSEDHLWDFTIEDIKEFLLPYGRPFISLYYEKMRPFILAYCEKT